MKVKNSICLSGGKEEIFDIFKIADETAAESIEIFCQIKLL